MRMKFLCFPLARIVSPNELEVGFSSVVPAFNTSGALAKSVQQASGGEAR